MMTAWSRTNIHKFVTTEEQAKLLFIYVKGNSMCMLLYVEATRRAIRNPAVNDSPETAGVLPGPSTAWGDVNTTNQRIERTDLTDLTDLTDWNS